MAAGSRQQAAAGSSRQAGSRQQAAVKLNSLFHPQDRRVGPRRVRKPNVRHDDVPGQGPHRRRAADGSPAIERPRQGRQVATRTADVAVQKRGVGWQLCRRCKDWGCGAAAVQCTHGAVFPPV